jgi:pseudouridine synthase
MRIQKYLSQQGILSRRETEAYIRQGRIKLNGEIMHEMGVQIDPMKDRVQVLEGKPLPAKSRRPSEKKVTIVLYKPRGITSSKNSAEGKNVFEAFPKLKHLNTVGRLDKESEGLLLLSNDGVITAVVTGEDHVVEKEYEVTVREEVRPWHLRKIEEGIMLDGKKTLPAKGELLGAHSFSLILKEGRHHQIRRMADAVHLTITQLVRVRIGNIKLDGLTSGKARMLSEKESVELKKLKK